jgi:hypothetical protein
MTTRARFSSAGGLGRRLTLLTAAAFAALAVAATASSQAAVIDTSACDGAPLSEPFAQWGDTNLYKLVADGDFASGVAGWTLSGGAQLVAGGETAGSSSLLLPAGASAQSPFTCVDAAYPTLRFFARNAGAVSSVLVQLVYETSSGAQVVLPAGAVTPSGSWQPTPPMLTDSAVAAALSGGVAEVSLRFTALLGAAQIDDIYIDPRCAW